MLPLNVEKLGIFYEMARRFKLSAHVYNLCIRIAGYLRSADVLSADNTPITRINEEPINLYVGWKYNSYEKVCINVNC